MKFCPKCATRNADDASVCRNAACGHRFATPGGASAASGGKAGETRRMHVTDSHAPAKGTNVNPEAKRYCRKCGSPNDGAATTCRCCGAALRLAMPPPPSPSPSPRPTPTPPPSPPLPAPVWRRCADAVRGWHPGLKVAAILAACFGLGIISQTGGGKRMSEATSSSTVSALVLSDNANGKTTMTRIPANDSGTSAQFPPPTIGGAGMGTSFGPWAPPTPMATTRNSSGDIHQRALQIIWNSCGRAMTDSELAIVEQSIREGRGTRKQKEAEIQNLRNMNANIRMQDSYWDMQCRSAALASASIKAESAKFDQECAIQGIKDDMHTRSLARIDGVSVDQYNTGGSLGITSWDGSQNGSRIGHTLGGDIFKVDQDGTAYRFDNGNWYRR